MILSTQAVRPTLTAQFFSHLMLVISLCSVFKMHMHCFPLQKITPKIYQYKARHVQPQPYVIGPYEQMPSLHTKNPEVSEHILPSSISQWKIHFIKVQYKSNSYSYAVILQYIILIFL